MPYQCSPVATRSRSTCGRCSRIWFLNSSWMSSTSCLQLLAAFVRVLAEHRQRALVAAGRDLLEVDALLLEQPMEVRQLREHADRADDRERRRDAAGRRRTPSDSRRSRRPCRRRRAASSPCCFSRSSCDAAKPCSWTVPPEFSSRSSTRSPGCATRNTADTSSRNDAAALARRSPLKSSTNMRGSRALVLGARLVLALALLVPRLRFLLVAAPCRRSTRLSSSAASSNRRFKCSTTRPSAWPRRRDADDQHDGDDHAARRTSRAARETGRRRRETRSPP